MATNAKWLNKVRWDEHGLVPVIAQEAATGDILMFAWMNREALARTAELGEAVYWSRSRKKLWHKGEESGHVQKVLEMRLDCDEDVVLLKIEQAGGIACHTGRQGPVRVRRPVVPLDGAAGPVQPDAAAGARRTGAPRRPVRPRGKGRAQGVSAYSRSCRGRPLS